jgi:processive 1,2-diacylglycerol beta-glucosyltransferase
MKILIIHASFGAGHRRAALALGEVFKQQSIEVEVQDLLDLLPRPLKWFYPWSYYFMIEDARWLWRTVYNLSNTPKSPYTPATSMLQKWQFTALKRYLQEEKFTHIIGTHFTPCALLTDWRKNENLDARIYSVITDYTAHRCWLRNGMNLYFVATEDVSKELLAAGIQPNHICVSGIPVSVAFSKKIPRQEARLTWGATADENVFLVLTSGLNLKITQELIQDLREIQGSFRYLISAGKEGERVEKIQEFCAGDDRFTIFGFSPRVPEMMNASDLVISKPGGLIISESLAMGVPQLLFSPIPGQEEANANYLVKENAAVCIEAKSGEFRKAIQNLLQNAGSLREMSETACRLGRPDAARTIVDKIIADKNSY